VALLVLMQGLIGMNVRGQLVWSAAEQLTMADARQNKKPATDVAIAGQLGR
jgi:hypothetical protein